MAFETMGDGLEQLLKTWVPIWAAVLSTALGFVPMGDVLRCRRNKSLGKVEHPLSEWVAVVRGLWRCCLTSCGRR